MDHLNFFTKNSKVPEFDCRRRIDEESTKCSVFRFRPADLSIGRPLNWSLNPNTLMNTFRRISERTISTTRPERIKVSNRETFVSFLSFEGFSGFLNKSRKKHEAIEHSSVFLKCFLSSFCYSDVSVTSAQRRTSSPRTPLQCSDVLKSVSHLC